MLTTVQYISVETNQNSWPVKLLYMENTSASKLRSLDNDFNWILYFWFDDTLVARSESFKPVARSIAIYATRRAVFDSVSQLLSTGVGFTTVWDWLSSLRRGSNALLHLSQTQFNQWLKRSWTFNPIKFNWYYWEWLRRFSCLTSRE